MPIISDNALDFELAKMKKTLEKLRHTITAFSGGIRNIAPQERAKMIKKIQTTQKILAGFIEHVKGQEVINSGTKYAVDNLQASHLALSLQWKKIERQLESYSMPNSTPKQEPPKTDAAINDYLAVLSSLGQPASKDQIAEFRLRIEGGYREALEKSGGKNIEIDVFQEDGKIKVKMRPE